MEGASSDTGIGLEGCPRITSHYIEGDCDQAHGGFDDLQCAEDACLYLTV
jgi:hypothetical protein